MYKNGPLDKLFKSLPSMTTVLVLDSAQVGEMIVDRETASKHIELASAERWACTTLHMKYRGFFTFLIAGSWASLFSPELTIGTTHLSFMLAPILS